MMRVLGRSKRCRSGGGLLAYLGGMRGFPNSPGDGISWYTGREGSLRELRGIGPRGEGRCVDSRREDRADRVESRVSRVVRSGGEVGCWETTLGSKRDASLIGGGGKANGLGVSSSSSSWRSGSIDLTRFNDIEDDGRLYIEIGEVGSGIIVGSLTPLSLDPITLLALGISAKALARSAAANAASAPARYSMLDCVRRLSSISLSRSKETVRRLV